MGVVRRIFKVTADSLPLDVLTEARKALLEGELIIYPTDTVYGLGANPMDEGALAKAFEVKRREEKPMPVLVSSVEAAGRLVEVTEEARLLMDRFWPGGLTIALPKKPSVPDALTRGLPTLGVRMPDHPIALQLAESIGGYILGTSANISGQPPPRTADEAAKQLAEVGLVIDAGPCKIGVASTVVDLTTRPPRIIRAGAVPPKSVLDALSSAV